MALWIRKLTVKTRRLELRSQHPCKKPGTTVCTHHPPRVETGGLLGLASQGSPTNTQLFRFIKNLFSKE